MGHVSVEDYLYYLRNSGAECNCMRVIFDECASLCNFLSRRYQVLDSPISLRIDPSSAINGRAIVSRNEIIVFRGTIDHCLQTGKNTKYEEVVNSRGIVRLEKLGAILWCIAHEFFHIARQHTAIKITDYRVQQAIEYDADNYAIAGLYRYIQSRAGESICRIDLKKIVLRSFYVSIRNFVGVDAMKSNGIGKAHPEWRIRLKYSIYKLLSLDVPHINYGVTNEFTDQIKPFVRELIDNEARYLAMKGVSNVQASSFLRSWLNGEISAKELEEQWAKIEPVVCAKSRLFTDMMQSGRSVMHIDAEGVVLYRLGWKYSKSRVTGIFAPVFHFNTKMDDRDPKYYRSDIIPNAYWRPVGERLQIP